MYESLAHFRTLCQYLIRIPLKEDHIISMCYQLSPQFVFQTSTTAVLAALNQSSHPAFLLHSRRLRTQVCPREHADWNVLISGPTIAVPPCVLHSNRPGFPVLVGVSL